MAVDELNLLLPSRACNLPGLLSGVVRAVCSDGRVLACISLMVSEQFHCPVHPLCCACRLALSLCSVSPATEPPGSLPDPESVQIHPAHSL